MIEDEGVRPEGCICEISSDIPLNCKDMRNKFEYTTLCAMRWQKGENIMRRKDRELKSKEELQHILYDGKFIQIAFVDGNEPYIVTLNYGYIWGDEKIKFYFHSAIEGRKINCIKNNPKVCFTIAICDPFTPGINACNYGIKYRSVVGYGKMKIVDNEEERIFGLNLLMKQFTGIDNWEYESEILKKTLITCLEVEELSGKKRK
jgi:nitroimidazol reductase NimA-like FMN-containing flavoprotein (pyridoxamine 5'-phosphate oxidase superfamily)